MAKSKDSEKATKDPQTIKNGKLIYKLPEGCSIRDLELITDDRGSLVEIFNPKWEWSEYPLTYSHIFIIRSKKIKGWALHKTFEDRYFVVTGEMQMVLYDERKDSKTYGLVSEIYLSDKRKQIINIPKGVWHADRNLRNSDLIVINFPTKLYNYKNPDKLRLPLDTNKIPFKFNNSKGW